MRECFGTLFFCGKGARIRSQEKGSKIDYTTKITVYYKQITKIINGELNE